MAQGDGATVDVNPVVRDIKLLHRRECNGREGFIDLEQVDVLD